MDYLKNLSRDVVNAAASIMNKTKAPVEVEIQEPEVVVESTELEEANKANKAKSSAFRAGKKAHAADKMDTKPYRHSRDSSADYKDKVDAAKFKKDAAKDKASRMKLVAKNKLKVLGKPTGGAVSAFNKGREVAKAPAKTVHPVDTKIRKNADTKKYDGPEYADKSSVFKVSGEGRGRFKQMHDTRQHEIVRRKIDDIHDKIRSKLKELEPSYSATREEGSGAIDKAKAHLEKLHKVHAALHESTEVEDFTDVINETLELVETVVVLSELYGDAE